MRAFAPGLQALKLRGALVLAAALTACAAPTESREQLLDPKTCASCHESHYREWSGSMHAYASTDPVFLAMNRRGQRLTGGELGSFCVQCHAPLAVSEGATRDGLNLESVPPRLQGVTCYFCHSAEGVEGSHNNSLKLSRDLQMRGPLRDPLSNTVHRSVYSPLHDRNRLESSSMCGAYHDVVTGHGAKLERTFSEWQSSVFGSGQRGATCGQCHMPQGPRKEAVANVQNAPQRRRHSHSFPAVDVALTDFPERTSQRAEVQAALDSTLAMGLCVTSGRPRIQVLVDNIGAGHGFPSGATQDRRLWAEVTAYAGGKVVYHSGAIADGQPEKTNDKDLWLLRDCIFDRDGGEVHDFWEAASFDSNSRERGERGHALGGGGLLVRRRVDAKRRVALPDDLRVSEVIRPCRTSSGRASNHSFTG